MAKDSAKLINTNAGGSEKVHPASPNTNVPAKASDKAAEDELKRLEKLEKEKEEKARQKKSFQYILRYQRREAAWFFWGMVALVLGSASDFVVPLYIGWVIDKLEVNDFDGVKDLCLQLLIIVLVSTHPHTPCGSQN